MHWKPETQSGEYHQNMVSKDSTIYTQNMMGTQTADSKDISTSVRNGQGLQDKYLLYPPVCYNNGRCVPKTSHSLVGVEQRINDANGDARKGEISSSSSLNMIHDLVNVGDTAP